MVTSPTPRALGLNFKDACGEQLFNNQNADPYGNIQALAQLIKADDFNATACNLAFCKGYQFSDANAADIQQFTAGQTLPMKIEIRAPHTGVANVSIVDAATGAMIGSPLISFTNYASTATGVAANNTEFSVTLPDVSSQCATTGACVLQWWWDSREVGQTYMNCIDFTMGSGSGSSPTTSSSPSSVPATSVAPTTLATVVTTPSAGPTTLATVTTSSAPATSTAPVDDTGDDECDATEPEDPEEGDDGEGDDDECDATEPEDPEEGDDGDDECDAADPEEPEDPTTCEEEVVFVDE
ncbi:putative chitin binding protein [Phaeoacremonium minimum UCRPA7]|uniref:Putative chitin binding protein n=1 Tax=Phaeoacremonium minimum (strain UCR-PA7) TaxID=1286976 RepID=R8BNT6_PHAM7|nr:putative chitin binding protein [Phaeoacremonium minimum UCRPA7]EOO00989.1 putative chitin binding protein [Phaeoacremonium minimum UCRPA7]